MTTKPTSMRGLLIPVEGAPTVVEVAVVNGKSTLNALQAFVGGNIEPVIMPLGQEGYINEEGKLIELEPNVYATYLWRKAVDEAGRMTLPGDYLVGPVIVLGPLDDEGYETPVQSAFVEMVMGTDPETIPRQAVYSRHTSA